MHLQCIAGIPFVTDGDWRGVQGIPHLRCTTVRQGAHQCWRRGVTSVLGPAFSVRQPNGRARLNHCTDVRRRSDAVRITLTRRTGPMNHKTPVQTDKLFDPRRGQEIGANPYFCGTSSSVEQDHVHQRRVKDNVPVVAQVQHSLVQPLLASRPRQSFGGFHHQPLQKRLHNALLEIFNAPCVGPSVNQITRQRCGNQTRQVPFPIPLFKQCFQRRGSRFTSQRSDVIKALDEVSFVLHAAR